VVQEDCGGRQDAVPVCEHSGSDGCGDDEKQASDEAEAGDSIKSESGQADWYIIAAAVDFPAATQDAEELEPKKKKRRRRRCIIS